MRRLSASLLLGVVACSSGSSGPPPVPRPHTPSSLFVRTQLTSDYHAEGACVGDFNQDGNLDVAYGPHWYAGPAYTAATVIYQAQPFSTATYTDVFFMFTDDVNADGWDDIITVGFPGTGAHWRQNPQGAPGAWAQHLIWPAVEFESPAFVDIDGDSQLELLCSSAGQLTYLKRVAGNPTAAWTPHTISPQRRFAAFTHGLGAGDINNDGRVDVVTANGWYEQPASLAGDPPWTEHPFVFGGGPGGAQIVVDDVDGDGDADVITSLDAHAFGLSWFEQQPGITFVEHVILSMNDDPGNPNQFSQLHGLTLGDMNGDGLQDIITGKTFLAHNGADPGSTEPPVLFVFFLDRTSGVVFTPACIDDASGVGRQVVARDMNNDAKVDIVSGNKNGAFVFTNQ